MHKPGDDLADIGALHVAELFDNVRYVRRFLEGYLKAASKRRLRR